MTNAMPMLKFSMVRSWESKSPVRSQNPAGSASSHAPLLRTFQVEHCKQRRDSHIERHNKMGSAKNIFPAKGDSLWLNVNLATITEGNPYGMVKDGVLVVGGGKIVWLGQRVDLPADYKSRVEKTYDGQGGWITPGLVDCHTHLVYAGSRAREFELLLQGATYEEIARQGGGIRSTVSATRAADAESLLNQSVPRLTALLAEGV